MPQWEKLSAVDRSTDAALTIDYSHHEIHDGSSYMVDHVATGVNSGANVDLLLTTPDTKSWAHFIWSIFATGEASVFLYEGPTTTGGTPLTVVNRNRNSSKVAGVSAAHTPSVSNVGTQLRNIRNGAGKTIPGTDRSTAEIILKQNTKYLFRVTSRAASNNICVSLDWYEHKDHA